jgi:hypothetical protein
LFRAGEEIFLTFKMTNGSGWLTSHRLILVKHEPGQLEDHIPEEYYLKIYEKAKIKKSTLTAHFTGKKPKFNSKTAFPSLLQEIKDYIEETAKNWKK